MFSTGMVQFGGLTYRIAEVGRGRYRATRISDDVYIGTFETFPISSLKADAREKSVLRGIARTAFMQGKTRRSRNAESLGPWSLSLSMLALFRLGFGRLVSPVLRPTPSAAKTLDLVPFANISG